MIKLDKKIIVIDLDGTFISVNTFHKWMIFIAKQAFKKLAFLSLINIFYTITLRVFKRINHAQMKYSILKISEKLISEIEIGNFVKSLNRYVHQDILNTLKDKETITILATAAPKIYAKKFSEIYGFNYEISTPASHKSNWKENLKEEKKKNLLVLLQKENLGLEVAVLYTDHHDDLPLMEYAKMTYLVNPSKGTIKYVNDTKVNYQFLKGL